MEDERPTSARSKRSSPRRRSIHLSLLQLTDWVLVGVLILAGVHVTGSMRVASLAGAALLGGLAFCTRGPLGAMTAVGARGHRVGAVLIALGLVGAPLVRPHGLDLTGVFVCEAVALVLLRLAWGLSAKPRHDPTPVGMSDDRGVLATRLSDPGGSPATGAHWARRLGATLAAARGPRRQ